MAERETEREGRRERERERERENLAQHGRVDHRGPLVLPPEMGRRLAK
eukprot:COSAG03_NODE_11064_length_613_cov_0.838521_2_plen_48_part_00